MKLSENFSKGIWRDNPVLVLVLGMCPTLAVTTSGYNGLGMGAATMAVLLGSNVVISIMRKAIPKRIRIPAFIVVIATFVSLVDLLLAAYQPVLHKELGIFIPLIVVNCIILGRAEAFASKNGLMDSVVDAIGMGLGFTLVLFVLGSVREILGSGTWTIFQYQQFKLALNAGQGYLAPVIVMILPPGAFITLGFMLAGMNKLRAAKRL